MNIVHTFFVLLFLIYPTYPQLISRPNIRLNDFQFPLSSNEYVNDAPLQQTLAVSPSSTSIRGNFDYDKNISDKISRTVMQLGQDILRLLELKHHSKASIISPISIVSALALLLLGSNGQTYQELANLFDFNGTNRIFQSQSHRFHEEFGKLLEDVTSDISSSIRLQSRPQPPWKSTRVRNDVRSSASSQNVDTVTKQQIRLANGIFIQNGFSLRKDYETVTRNVYSSEMKSLDFYRNTDIAKNYINNWVRDKTHDKIKTIIDDDISPYTRIIIANALYFKAEWEKMFLNSATIPIDFFPNGINAAPIKVDMMANGGVFPHYDSQEYGCQIIGLPYKENISTMYIIQPYDSSSRKLRQFQASLTPEKIELMISKMTKRSAIMLFPKLHLTNSLQLKQILAEFGVRSIFNENQCDFSLMTDYSSQPNRTLSRRQKRKVTYKVESSFVRELEPLRLKDLIINKRVTKQSIGKKLSRARRQALYNENDVVNSIRNLDSLRDTSGLRNPHLFVDNIIHKVDLVVDERGTEGGAATATVLWRTGTDVVFRADTPFMVLVRHDPTKLPLFYGNVYEPTN